METLWFIIIGFMLAMYVVFDGFDLGAGIIHLIIAKTDADRRTILNAIGPFWDGNEVWLLAAAGTLYFAFPLLYASAFSGLYIPLTVVLWLFILRGAAIEFRHHIDNSNWKSVWDIIFSLSSLLLAIIFGAALGNVIRGVPLNPEGYFFEPLWTTFTVVPEAGVLDWFTILMGLVALTVLTLHGATFIAMKTEGELQKRALSMAVIAWYGVILTTIFALIAVCNIQPGIFGNFLNYKWGIIFPAIAAAAIASSSLFRYKGKGILSFLSSSLFIVSMMAATAFALYPNLLTALSNRNFSITVERAAAHEYGLSVGLVWWIIGILLATAYFFYLYCKFRGKVKFSTDTDGY